MPGVCANDIAGDFGTSNTLAHRGVFVCGIQQALSQGSKHELCAQETPIAVRKKSVVPSSTNVIVLEEEQNLISA